MRFRDARGTYLIELAIALPIFFGMIFVFVDFARIGTGYSTVRSAAALAARRGAASGRLVWDDLEDFDWNGGKVTQSNFVGVVSNSSGLPVFRSAGQDADWYDCIMTNSTDSWCYVSTRGPTPELTFQEVRAIGYANEVLKRNLTQTSFPCMASAPDDPWNGSPGCFRCFTLRNDSRYGWFFETQGPGAGTELLYGRGLAIGCEYDVPITSTSFAFGWLPSFITVRSTAFVTVNF